MVNFRAVRVSSVLTLVGALVLPVAPAYAWDRWHHEGGWGGGREWNERHGWGERGCDGCGIAGALLGFGIGAALFGGAPAPVYNPPPVYVQPPAYTPPPVVYYPPQQTVYPPPVVYYGRDRDDD